MGRREDPRSWEKFQERLGSGWAPLGLPVAGTSELSQHWAEFQMSSDKLPTKAGAWRKTGNPQIQTKTEEKKIWVLVSGLKG